MLESAGLPKLAGLAGLKRIKLAGLLAKERLALAGPAQIGGSSWPNKVWIGWSL